MKEEIIYTINTHINYIKPNIKNKSHSGTTHIHKELQIFVVTCGSEVCIVKDVVVKCNKYDILLIGADVPHSSHFYKENKNEGKVIILKFPMDIFPEKISELPDYKNIANILKQSQNGLLFQDKELGKEVLKILSEMESTKRTFRINQLFTILDILEQSKEKTFVCKTAAEESTNFKKDSIQRVYDYLHTNMTQEITLEQVAQHANMSVSALCRIFKTRTSTTIFEFLTKIRLDNVCKLLICTNLPITEIAYQSGFNSIGYFNRLFKGNFDISPSQYRKKHKTPI